MTFLILHGIDGKAGDHWEQWLHDELVAQGHIVLMPTLPDADHPERSVWLAEIKNILKDVPLENLVLVGHSLGVPTALDFIEGAPGKVKALLSISGFATDYGSELNSYFMKQKQIDFSLIQEHLDERFVFFGDNDPYVPQDVLSALADSLQVTPRVFHHAGHLNTDAGFIEFPELLQVIEKIAAQ